MLKDRSESRQPPRCSVPPRSPLPPARQGRLRCVCLPRLQAGRRPDHHVAEGYEADILRAGRSPRPGLAPFDAQNLTAADQAKRFGYNNDYVAFFPLRCKRHARLLCVNHEYANPEVMFPGLGVRPDRNDFRQDDASTSASKWRRTAAERGGDSD